MSKRWLALIPVLWFSTFSLAEEAPTKIVIIHDGTTITQAKLLETCLEKTKNVQVTTSSGWPKDEAILKGVKSIVLLPDKAADIVFDKKHKESFTELMTSGVGLVALHGAVIADLGVGEELKKLIGGWANREFAGHLTHNAETKVGDSPAAVGVKIDRLRAHYYLKLRMAPKIQPVLSTTLAGDVYPLAWTFDREKGKSFAFVGGMTTDSFKNEMVRRMLANGILYTAGVKLPATGAKVDMKPEEFNVMGDIKAEIVTDKGSIHLKLYADQTPVTCANFVNLAQRGYYDGLNFHRVIADFMIQGGCPEGTGRGGPGYKFEDETTPALKHDSAGILSMANAGPGTNGSQFFITHKATPHLDGRHTVFGKVVSKDDQKVVDAIRKGDKIKTIRITGDTTALMSAMQKRVDEWNKQIDAKFPNKDLKPATTSTSESKPDK